MARFGMTMFRRRPPATLIELVATMPERELQNEVAQLFKLFGWKFIHQWNSIHTEEGWPDCFATRGTRIIVAELKKEGKNPTVAQQQWLEALKATGKIETYIFHPSDRDRIEQILR